MRPSRIPPRVAARHGRQARPAGREPGLPCLLGNFVNYPDRSRSRPCLAPPPRAPASRPVHGWHACSSLIMRGKGLTARCRCATSWGTLAVGDLTHPPSSRGVEPLLDRGRAVALTGSRPSCFRVQPAPTPHLSDYRKNPVDAPKRPASGRKRVSGGCIPASPASRSVGASGAFTPHPAPHGLRPAAFHAVDAPKRPVSGRKHVSGPRIPGVALSRAVGHPWAGDGLGWYLCVQGACAGCIAFVNTTRRSRRFRMSPSDRVARRIALRHTRRVAARARLAASVLAMSGLFPRRRTLTISAPLRSVLGSAGGATRAHNLGTTASSRGCSGNGREGVSIPSLRYRRVRSWMALRV